MKKIEIKVVEWAQEKGLIFPENSGKQFLKFIEETGEVAKAILTNDIKNLELEIGDVLVTLTILAAMKDLSLSESYDGRKIHGFGHPESFFDFIYRAGILAVSMKYGEFTFKNSLYYLILHLKSLAAFHGLELENCYEKAYQKIKNRTGETIDGNFIKNEEK